MTLNYQFGTSLRILFMNGILALKRQTNLIISLFLTPFTFVYFLYLVSPRTELPFGVVGAIIFTTVFTGNAMMNDSAYYRLEHHIQDLYVASPVRPLFYVLGLALSELVFVVPPLVILFLILSTVERLTLFNVAAMLATVLLTWIMASSLGFMIASFFREYREIWPIASVTFNSISIIPPVFYPISVIPSAFRWIAYVVPTTYSALLGDAAVGLRGSSSSMIPLYALSLVISTAIFVGVAALFTRWREA